MRLDVTDMGLVQCNTLTTIPNDGRHVGKSKKGVWSLSKKIACGKN